MLMFRPLIRYAVFNGRARRAEYWLFVLLQFLVIGGCLGMAFGSLTQENIGAGLAGFMVWFGFSGLASLALILPYFAVLARRLHDIGQTAWWVMLLLPSYLWPFLSGGSLAGAAGQLNAGVSEATATAIFAQAFAQNALIVMIAGACNLALFVMTLLPGTRGPNRFGPDPRNPDAPARDAPGRDAPSSVYDEARLEELFAEAKRERDGPYKPVFDFGPGPSQPQPQPQPVAQAAPTPAPAWDPGIAPARPFGRRGA